MEFKKPLQNKQVSLADREWDWFKIKDLFNLEKGKCPSADKLLENGDDIFYIGAKKNNNGLMNKVVENKKITSKGNSIVFIGDGQGSVGCHTYQPIDFIGSSTLTIGYIKELNEYIAMFLITTLDKEKYRYSYGRKYGKTIIANSIIKLPVTKDGAPDWKFMEDYIKTKSLLLKLPSKKPFQNKQVSLADREWDWFEYRNIFDIKRGKDIVGDLNNGNMHLISACGLDNGLNSKIKTGKKLFKKNSITIANNGSSVGASFFQDKDFYATTDVTILNNINLNVYNAMFIVNLTKKEKYRFNYGRKWSNNKMEKTKIKLPVTKDGAPDWKFMEDYIKSLPYSSNL